MAQSPGNPAFISPDSGTTIMGEAQPSLDRLVALTTLTRSESAKTPLSLADRVIAATGPRASPRLAAILPSLVWHLHAFALESRLTVAEWTAGMKFINESGRMSDDKRNETQLLCDILGLESLIDSLASSHTGSTSGGGTAVAFRNPATPSAILGPFYRHDAPDVPNGGSIVRSQVDASAGDTVLVRGFVRVAGTGLPLTGAHAAVLDVWQSAPNGLYEQQDPSQPDMNLRGRVTASRHDGQFSFYTLRPAPYPIPNDGPAGRLLELLDRPMMRPAHLHFVVSAPGYGTLVTQLFDALDVNLRQDSVFAVKDNLVVNFQQLDGDSQARWVLNYDFHLAPEVSKT